MLQRHLNEQGPYLHDASVPGAAPAPGSVTVLVLQVPGQQAPHRLLLDEPQAAQIKPGDTLARVFFPGRFRGLFVTDWQVTLPVAPAQPVTTFPAAPAPAL